MPRMNLEGSSSIVTGGASGIGEACARQLAAAGSKVVIADLNEERGKQIADEIGGVFVKCDVTRTEDADAAVTATAEQERHTAMVLHTITMQTRHTMTGRTISYAKGHTTRPEETHNFLDAGPWVLSLWAHRSMAWGHWPWAQGWDAWAWAHGPRSLGYWALYRVPVALGLLYMKFPSGIPR